MDGERLWQLDVDVYRGDDSAGDYDEDTAAHHRYGDLRALIDELNSFAEPAGPPAAGPPAAEPAGPPAVANPI